MPPITDLQPPPGTNQTVPVPPSGLGLGYQAYYHYVQTVEFFSGTAIPEGSQWRTIRSIFVNENNSWMPVRDVHVLSGGEWKPTGTNLYRIRTDRTTRYKISSVSHYREPGGAYHFHTFTIRNIPGISPQSRYWIPSGLKMLGYDSSGVYDDCMDGVFWGQSEFLSTSNRRAIIMSSRENPSWVGRNTERYKTWSTWSSAPRDIPCGGSWRRLCGKVRTQNYPAHRCSCDGCYERIIPDTFVVPFNIDQWVSVKVGDSCTTCNHGAHLIESIFEDPNSKVTTFDPW